MERNRISLVFGGRGFIGSNISKHFTTNFVEHKVIGRKECDLTNKAEVLEHLNLFKDYELDIVFTSSIVRKREDSKNSKFLNISMVKNLIEIIEGFNIRSFIFLSSIDVYYLGEEELNENSPTRSISPYAISKLESEKLLTDLLANKLTILRIPGVYGPNDNSNSVVGHLTKKILSKETVEVTNSGFQKRDYLYVDDISRAVFSLIKKPCDGIFNLSTGKSTNLIEIIALIANNLKMKPKIKEIESDSKNNFIKVSNKKFLNKFSEFKFTPIDTGIRKYIETLN